MYVEFMTTSRDEFLALGRLRSKKVHDRYVASSVTMVGNTTSNRKVRLRQPGAEVVYESALER